MRQRDDARLPRPLVGSSGPIVRSINLLFRVVVGCSGVCCEDAWSSCGKPRQKLDMQKEASLRLVEGDEELES